MKVKYHKLYIIILLIFSTTYIFGQKRVPYSVKISIDTLVEKNITVCDSNKTISLKVEIKNTTRKTRFLWLWNCSISNSFLSNNKGILICEEICFRNFPEIISLLPNQVFTINIELYKTEQSMNNNLMIGFINVDTSEALSFNDFFKALEEKKISNQVIWSNDLLIK
ncbi:MAG: hypothetical protein K9H61_04205 [Bacteroidia bacterium]|nr:hypothetical protein [Bacteroidia bacterium]MCF8426411.1 hypothetical protein [Bacteroidia bacterium]MCF8446179.1 hypothetical protein [Bacteroidia bacterium]